MAIVKKKKKETQTENTAQNKWIKSTYPSGQHLLWWVILLYTAPVRTSVTLSCYVGGIFSYMSGESLSRSLSLALSWRRDGMGGGGGGTGEGDGSRGPSCPPLSEGLLDRGLYVCVRGGGWAMVALEDKLCSSVKRQDGGDKGGRSNEASKPERRRHIDWEDITYCLKHNFCYIKRKSYHCLWKRMLHCMYQNSHHL